MLKYEIRENNDLVRIEYLRKLLDTIIELIVEPTIKLPNGSNTTTEKKKRDRGRLRKIASS